MTQRGKTSNCSSRGSWTPPAQAPFFLGNIVHPTPYSSWCCLGEVDLELQTQDSTEQTYTFVNPARRGELENAVSATSPAVAVSMAAMTTASSDPESQVEAKTRRRAAEETCKAERQAAVAADVREVVRAPGKRRATALAK